MTLRKHQNSEIFPRRCEVRRCTAPPQTWYSAGSFEYEICGRHELELRAGEPYSVDEGEILVGQDATGELLAVEVDRTAGNVLLRLGRFGAVNQVVRLDMPSGLRSALDALGADESALSDHYRDDR